MANAASVHIGVGTNSICAGIKAAETTNAKAVQPLASYTLEETKLLEDYYGVPLALLAGIKFGHNTEQRPFFAELSEIE